MEAMSLRAYARHRGVTLSTVQKWIRTGYVSLRPDGLIDPDSADVELDTRLRASPRPTTLTRPKPGARVGGQSGNGRGEVGPGLGLPGAMSAGDGVAGKYAVSRAAKEMYGAKILELEYRVRVGELVSAAEVRDAVTLAVRQVRDVVLNLPSQAGPLMAGLAPHECIIILTRECERIVDEFRVSMSPLGAEKNGHEPHGQ